MHGITGEREPLMPDLTGLPLDDILTGSSNALVNALHRVVDEVAAAEPAISAYDSGAQLLPTGPSDRP
ncbi:hypothetical protein SSOG_03745 [Streptomyces himastatinicus ATCC 53653]|uniref:FXSXX-COOH protein n=2 Tax=Streptomyces TaxID=1883 RepID=D9WR65_9ACTN|nr:hypothetical protein SSOG_03745 [Streptomyces himastatinicus ATCC 53653]